MEGNNLSDPQVPQVTEEELLLKEENIPGLTICSRNMEEEIMEELNKQFNEQTEQNDDGEEESANNPQEKVSLAFVSSVENETENERKVRLGEMTPFGSVLQSTSKPSSATESQISRYLQQQALLKKNYVARNKTSTNIKTCSEAKLPAKTRKRPRQESLGTETVDYIPYRKQEPLLSERATINFEDGSGSDYMPSSDAGEPTDEDDEKIRHERPRKRRKAVSDCVIETYNSNSDSSPTISKAVRIKVEKEKDDGNESEFQIRLKAYEKLFEETEMLFHEFEDCHFKIPLEIWSKLYNYQKVGVQWLWELHLQGVGGILADEMGLGKTIQIISFFAGLYYSRLKNKYNSFRGLGPSLIICPTTLMYQWVKEFHLWLPPVRVAILHACGSFSGERRNLIRDISRNRGILVTSYSGLVQLREELLKYSWHYVILDEGHKIRNPDAKITLTAKQLKTPHRLILSGSPLQNNLEELWSLFDFIFPGKLGSLPLFQSQFAVPITHGGYANASNVEVTIAYKCATVLKELISPYLLRRSKQDVKSHLNLPQKNEQVLFCQLTDIQRDYYKGYIDSGEVHRILEGQAQIFVGLINLRKICNHPDLYSGGPKLLTGESDINIPEEERYGYWKKSGKMIVLETLLKIWHKQNHKVLLFSQGKKMLDILEQFVRSCKYTYLKMDGTTCIGSRQPLIDKFNTDPNYFVMLLTTRVGGLGINLTGANRIVIFDPDWNPATDTQARERAWRIGQTQDVTIYRLISVGTIEEKIYHRQIFKQFLTNKVLKDPKQRRFFKSNDLFELFTLKESSQRGSTETGAIFAGTGSEINMNVLSMKKRIRERKLEERIEVEVAQHFSESKIQQMKLIAQRISQKLTENKSKVQSKSKEETAEQTITDETTVSTTSKDEAKLCKVVQEVDQKSNVESPTSSNSDAKLGFKKASSKENILSSSNSTYSSTKSPVSKKKVVEREDCVAGPSGIVSSKKKKKKKSYFEGEFVPFLVSTKKSKRKEKEEEGESIEAVQDEYVLQKLFSKAGICSALQHDTIMEGGPADFAIVEQEAQKIAEEAVNELKKSQQQCFSAQSGIPNWTGKHGGVSKSGPSSKLINSQSILDKIKKRNGEVMETKSETQILNNLKNFIQTEGGTASTARLIKKFEDELPPTATPLFKCLLNKICTFYRGPDNLGYWTLKTEFLR